jgi:uncharacterized protein YbaR (Trm112 family)
MTNEFLVEIACPNCRHPIDVREHGRHVTCDACRSQFILQAHLCPQCQNYHQQDEAICGQCGASLSRLCRKCQASNWAGDEYCRQCGSAMDIFDILVHSQSGYTADRLDQQMRQARDLKALEAAASARRMAELEAIEAERVTALRQRQRERKAAERRLLWLMGGAAVLILFFLLLYLLFGWLN